MAFEICPVLAQLATAAVAGLPPAGPAECRREPVVLAARGGPEIVGDLMVQDCGFSAPPYGRSVTRLSPTTHQKELFPDS